MARPVAAMETSPSTFPYTAAVSLCPTPRCCLTLSMLIVGFLGMSCGGFSLSSLHTMAAATPQEPPRMQRVLVFGGNGFLGGATVERMLAAGHYQVVTVNRGNWYWDSAFVVKPHVTQVTCDRLYPLERCEQLVNMVKDEGFDVVVDFSAYHPDAVTGALKVSWIGQSVTGRLRRRRRGVMIIG